MLHQTGGIFYRVKWSRRNEPTVEEIIPQENIFDGNEVRVLRKRTNMDSSTETNRAAKPKMLSKKTTVTKGGNARNEKFAIGDTFIAYFNNRAFLGVVVNIQNLEKDMPSYRCVFPIDGEIHDLSEEKLEKCIETSSNALKGRVAKRQMGTVHMGKELKIYCAKIDDWRYGTVESIKDKKKYLVTIMFDGNKDNVEECDLTKLGVDFSYDEGVKATSDTRRKSKRQKNNHGLSNANATNDTGESYQFPHWKL